MKATPLLLAMTLLGTNNVMAASATFDVVEAYGIGPDCGPTRWPITVPTVGPIVIAPSLPPVIDPLTVQWSLAIPDEAVIHESRLK